MTDLITSPLRAGRHVAAWVVWHSIGISLIADGQDGKTA
jgi:hypothetical protein